MFGALRFRRVSLANGSSDFDRRAGAGLARGRTARITEARSIAWTAALLLSLAVACSEEASSAAEGAITPQQVAAMLEAGEASVILDVRTPDEFASGHIPGAINIPHTELSARTDELGAHRADEIVVLCERGGRARSARAVLTAAGFEDVLDLTGHMGAWRAGNFPVE